MTSPPNTTESSRGARKSGPRYPGELAGAFLAALALVTAGLSCSSAAESTPRRGGWLCIAIEGDQRTLDPVRITSGHEGMLAALIYESLLDYTADGTFVPALAIELPRVSADGRLLEFRLRPDVRFSNGRPVTAEDVVYSIERCLDPTRGAIGGINFHGIRGAASFESARRSELERTTTNPAPAGGRWIEPRSLPGVAVTGPHTLRFELEQPNPYLLHVLASPVSAIVPREEVERPGVDFGTRPVGTGPFVLRDWTRGIRMEFDRNPRYRDPIRPYLDGVSVAVGIDLPVQAMMFERGDLDLMSMVTDVDFLRFRRSPELRSRIDSLPGVLPHYVTLNCELEPFTNRLVRAALNHAVDREAIRRALFSRGIVARGPLAPSVRGFNPNLPEYRFDPARARVLLAEAGYPDGFETTLWVARENPAHTKIALMIQEQFSGVGVTVRIQEANGSAFNDLTQRRRRVPMAVSNWGATFDDPRDTLELLSGGSITEEACLNLAFYSNDEVNELFRRAAFEADADRRLRFYQQAEERIVRDAPWVFLVHLDDDHLRQPWLRGYRHRPIWPSVRLDGCWLER